MAKLVSIFIVSALCTVAQSPDWKAAVQSKLLSQYALTSGKGSRVTYGSVLVLKKDNLGLYSTKAPLGYTPTNTYADGIIKPELSALLGRKVREGTARIFASGEKLYVFQIDVKNDAVVLGFLSQPVEDVIFLGSLRFPFPKGSPPSPEQAAQTIAQVFAVEGATPADGATSGPGSIISAAPRDSSDRGNSAPTSSRPQDSAGDPAKLDVAGVKLGMAPDEAIDALKKFDSWPVLQKRYIYQVTYQSVVGQLGQTDDCGINKTDSFRMLVAIVASKGKTSDVPLNTGPRGSHLSPECEWSGMPASSKPDEDPTEVVVYFSPTPGQERVIAVSLWRSFKNEPPVTAVTEAATTKYAVETTWTGGTPQGSQDPGTYMSWRFDNRNRVMSEETARRDGFLGRKAGSGYGVSLPLVLETEGVGIDVFVSQDNRNTALARAYSATLFRGSDLVGFLPQARAAYNGAEERKKNEELDKAKKASAPIKF